MSYKHITIEDITKYELVMVFTEKSSLEHKVGLNVSTDKPFTVIKPSCASNWARMQMARYYADVSIPTDATVYRESHNEFTTDRAIFGELRDIWDHPDFNIEYYIGYHEHLMPMLPEHAFSEQLAVKLVSRYSGNIRYIPQKYLTEKLMQLAIDKGCSLSSIKEASLTPTIIDYALKKDHMNYLGVPKHLRTPEMESSWNYYARRRSRQGP